MQGLWIHWPPGLMIMLIGKVTKDFALLISLDKIYDGEFLLGIETDVVRMLM